MNHPTPDDIVDFIHAALPPGEDARLHLHLAECSPCRDAYRAEVAVGESLRAAARSAERDMPDLLKARILQAAREETRASRAASFTARFRPIIAVPAAAAVLFAASLALPNLHAPGGSTAPSAIDARVYLDVHHAQSAGNPLAEHSGASIPSDASFQETSASGVIR